RLARDSLGMSTNPTPTATRSAAVIAITRTGGRYIRERARVRMRFGFRCSILARNSNSLRRSRSSTSTGISTSVLLRINSSMVWFASLSSMAGFLLLKCRNEMREQRTQPVASPPHVLADRLLPTAECRGNIAVRDIFYRMHENCRRLSLRQKPDCAQHLGTLFRRKNVLYGRSRGIHGVFRKVALFDPLPLTHPAPENVVCRINADMQDQRIRIRVSHYALPTFPHR